MMIDDDKLKYPKVEIIKKDNLLRFVFDFCDAKDLLYLSLVSKKFKKITETLDYKFEEAIEKNYFSNYSNYE